MPLSQIAGVIITGIAPLRWLRANKQLDALFTCTGPGRALLIGLAFGFGWTPCVGPIRAVILALAASQAALGQGVAFLALYSLASGSNFQRRTPDQRPSLLGRRAAPFVPAHNPQRAWQCGEIRQEC